MLNFNIKWLLILQTYKKTDSHYHNESQSKDNFYYMEILKQKLLTTNL